MARRTRVKICGITRVEDALRADELGVDALGFVFVPKSKRYIDVQSAKAIACQVSPFVTRVGLFLDAEAAVVHEALAAIPELVPQFHGRESSDYCEQFERPYLKAIGMAGGLPTEQELARFENCGGFLFDSNAPGELGGTGHTFDWQSLVGGVNVPVILAGGLDAHNVGDGIKTLQPFAVDVSSGVEADKGIKDHDAMYQFMQAVARADG